MNTKHWCTVWGNAMSITEYKIENYSKNITLRYPVTMPFSGDMIRIHLDNFCGTEDVPIASVFIALTGDTKRSIDKTSLKQLTFSQKTDCVIKAGESVISDPVSFPVMQGTEITISMYIKDFAQMRSSVIATGPLSGGFFSIGDHCQAQTLPMELTRTTNCYHFLSAIELYTDSENHAIVCYGDSITAQDWPDHLQLLYLAQTDNHTAIVRKAASGTRILRQYDCITYASYGLKATVRFPHELPVNGACAIILQQGINDIIHPVGEAVNPFRPMTDLPTVEELKDGFTYYIEQSKKLGYKIYVGTLLPIEGWRTYELFREDMKNAFNDWLREAPFHTTCIDFAQAVCDPDHKERFGEGYDSGDHLHPSAAAYRQMAKVAYETLTRS